MDIQARIERLDPLVRKMAEVCGRDEAEALLLVRQVMLGFNQGTQVSAWEPLSRWYGLTLQKLADAGAELSYPDQIMLHRDLGKHMQAMEALERYLADTYGPVFAVVVHSAGLEKGGGSFGAHYSEEAARAAAQELANEHNAPCRVSNVYRQVLLEPPVFPTQVRSRS